MKKEIKMWEKLSDESVFSAKVFELRKKRMRAPKGDYESDFFYITSADFVNIIALTEENKVVLVKQYRHGIHGICLETPGGLADKEANPEETAHRELKEETGYSTKQITSLGWFHPNPAIQENKCHLFLAKGVTKTTSQNLDPAEDISVELVELKEIPKLIQNNSITHAVSLCAFLRLFQLPEYKSIMYKSAL